ncbi:MAG: MBOAT family protein [Bacteroidaceae bacterium]|nr:MBOAT family protein [Bacteroidaceae bacterium]
MDINSTAFLLFFLIVFGVYYIPLKNSVRGQNLWLLLCSYASFAIADGRMLFLLVGATVVFFLLGLLIGKNNHVNERKASWLTTLGTLLGVGVLVYFKYLNFLIDSFSSLLTAIGFKVSMCTLHIIMPVGVSFFTFKLISYIVEVHRGHIQPCRDFIAFATYVAFFPTLIAGPIDRPKSFLAQLGTVRRFCYPSPDNMAVDGLRQILWGLFKKVVIADSLVTFVDLGWSHTAESTPAALWLVALVYPIQLYTDFSGYSDMAIGVSKLLGIRVAKNFNYPFFARNMADYWRRWHISLTSWLTDYVFMPLNIRFRDWDNMGMILACVINMVVVGVWHGANWTYALFGLYHGLLFVPLILNGEFLSKRKVKFEGYKPPLSYLGKMMQTYLLVALGMVLFRADSVGGLVDFVQGMLVGNGDGVECSLEAAMFPKATFLIALLMFAAEWVAMVKKKEFALQLATGWRPWLRYTTYTLLVALYLLKVGGSYGFIYAQF